MPKSFHFDVVALLEAVYAQPIGLAITTNHPQGFRRLVYLEARQRPSLKVQILQSPDSSMGFYLVRDGVEVNEVVQELSE